MRPVVCTGFDITDALRKYLESGHNIDLKPVFISIPGIDELEEPEEFLDDPELLEATERAAFVGSLRRHFCRLRKNASAEDRKLLEIPCSFEKQSPESGWQRRLFIPTGAHIRDRYISWALNTPSEQDLNAIQSFIESANRLLPDETARESGGFKLDDLQYEVRPTRTLTLPLYREWERKELLPPRYLEPFRRKAVK